MSVLNVQYFYLFIYCHWQDLICFEKLSRNEFKRLCQHFYHSVYYNDKNLFENAIMKIILGSCLFTTY